MKISKIVGAAYDYKASLDLAAAFVRGGLSVDVWNGDTYHAESQTQVSVYNLESFFWTPEQEYESVVKLFSAAPEDALCYMKSDSSLRGNLGSELRGLMDSRKQKQLIFISALPGAKKFFEAGEQYQVLENGKTVLANAEKLISDFRDTPVSLGKGLDAEGVCIPDCTTPEQFEDLVKALGEKQPVVLAGTGALAEKLGAVYGLPRKANVELDGKPGTLILDTLDWEEKA